MCVYYYYHSILLTHHTTLGSLVSHGLVQKIEVDTIITKVIQGKDLGEKEIMTSAL